MELKIKKEIKVINDKVTICQLRATFETSSDRYKLYPNVVFTSKGKAVCDDEDVYDMSIGNKIAYTKAKLSLYEKVEKFINKELMKFEVISFNLEDLKDSIDNRIEEMYQ